MDTDIALTTFSGDDGLNVFARSLQTALPLAGLEVVLLSRGNEPMAKLMTDEAGRVLFAAGLLKGRGAARAGAVMASNATNQDFSRLELGKTPFDFSDRGVTGRDQPGPVDAFLYTERGVYRPGETVQLMAMLRDAAAVALANMPITLIVKRPDGSEFTRFTQPVVAGGVHQPIALPKSSRRGRWTVAAHVDPKAPPVGTVEFSVEDFVPEKLKVELSTSQPFVKPGQVNNFDIQADFLYGAPGSGLTVEADMRITVDAQPFPAFARYSFGSHEERKAFEPPFLTLKAPDTDATGKSRLEWGGDIKDTPLPLRAQVQVRVFEPGGGRATKTEKTLPMRTRNAYIGIRPTFEGRYAREGAETQFDVVAVDATGKQVARPGIEYKVERTDWIYQWYEVDGRWRWQSIANPRLMAADTVSLPGDQPARLTFTLSWGAHQAHGHRPREQHLQHDAVLRRLVRRLGQRRGDARHAARGQRQGKLHAGRDGARAHRRAVRRPGDAGHRHRPHHQHAQRRGAGRRHDRRGAGVGRLGPRRLCPGDRLAAARQAGRSHADARHRPCLAGPGAASCARSPCRSARLRRSRRASASRCRSRSATSRARKPS